MNKRQAKKIVIALMHGRSYKSWKKSTLIEASETTFGNPHGRSAIGTILWFRASAPDKLKSLMESFSRLAKAFDQATATLQKFSKETDHALAA